MTQVSGSSISRGYFRLRFKPVDLVLRHSFSISGHTRSVTPAVLTEIEYDGLTGYGEANMPPYLGESQATVSDFLSAVDLSGFRDLSDLDQILDYIDFMKPRNQAAKASIDIALHDLAGKATGNPLWKMWGLDPSLAPLTSMTIGIDSPDQIRIKVKEAEKFIVLKIKLGSGNDKEIIETVREVTDKPLYADVNQGWKDRQHALDMAFWLKERNVLILEQPMPLAQRDDLAWLTERSPLPVVADEGVKTLSDLESAKGVYAGINIKLMKCGGLRNARRMLEKARKAGMKVMIGCMTETSCAVSAAAQLSPAADWADLDGNHLISNDFFHGVTVADGRIVLKELPGIGIVKKKSC